MRLARLKARRKLWLKVHLWLGLFLALIGLIRWLQKRRAAHGKTRRNSLNPPGGVIPRAPPKYPA
ncbi:hypothetical protein [Methylomagnum ishizawai]|uniref:hypothetical protein n=1 Tax=Methylomagnum ishizawai TaxID=1760988 RepID=UPI000A1697F2|nr:hypothetical protein [Methylomagnum ishizawai]